MNQFQQQIHAFATERGWAQFHNPKDLLLGIVEEIGEIRNLVKWEQDPDILKRVLTENRAELEDNIGDIYWFLALLANQQGINMDDAITGVIENNKKRFPVDKTRDQHTNLKLGGHDGQYSSV